MEKLLDAIMNKLLAGGFGQVKSNDRIVTAEDVEG